MQASLGLGVEVRGAPRCPRPGTPVISSTVVGRVGRHELGELRRSPRCARPRTSWSTRPSRIDHVRQAVEQRRVGAGPRCRGAARRSRRARCGAGRAVISFMPLERRLLDARAHDRVALGGVGADEERHLGGLDVVEGAGGAREAERLAQRERRGRVADARAVVDVVRADRGAHQALHHVAVLVRRARGGEAGDRVGAVLGLDARRARRRCGRSPPPTMRSAEAAALADQRRGEAVARARELVREAALHAGVALVRGAVERRADRHDRARRARGPPGGSRRRSSRRSW